MSLSSMKGKLLLAGTGLFVLLGVVAAVAMRGPSNAQQLEIAKDHHQHDHLRVEAIKVLVADTTPEELTRLLEGLSTEERIRVPALLVASGEPSFARELFEHVVDFGGYKIDPLSKRVEEALRPFGNDVMADLFVLILTKGKEEMERRVAFRLLSKLPAETVLPRIAGIQPLSLRGAFPEVLATSKGPDQVPAILAWLVANPKRAEVDWKRGLKAMFELDRPRTLATLFKRLESRREARVLKALREHASQDEFRAGVLAMRDLARKGSFSAELIEDGDPEHVRAIVAHWRKGTRKEETTAATARAVLAFGERALPEVRKMVERHASSSTDYDLAIRVLAALRPKEVAKRSLDTLQRWNKIAKRKARSYRSSLDHQDPLEDARSRFSPLVELRQLTEAEGEEIDACYLHGMGNADPKVAKFCAPVLARRLKTPEKLVDALFRHISSKRSFNLTEVELFGQLLAKGGARSAKRVATHLARLLDEEKGDASDVSFVLKYIGFQQLSKHGTAAEIPVLERYLKDTTAYTIGKRSFDPDAASRRFSDLCQGAIDAIKAR